MTIAYDPRERILPELVAHDDALLQNQRVIAGFMRDRGVEHAPHAKTHMSRELVKRQEPDVWGFTVATPAQAMTLVNWGARRVLHANLLVDPAAVSWIARETLASGSDVRYLCQVDSLEAVAFLDAELGHLDADRPLDVLVELGFRGGRTGARDAGAGLAIGQAVAASPHLRWAGVTAFEGLMPGGVDADGFPAGARELLADMRRLVSRGRGARLLCDDPIVSAGGSSYLDLVADALGPARWDEPVETVLRSGCAHVHDHGVYERTSPFGTGRGDGSLRPALELRARVLSAPEPGLAILGFGRREAPTDDRMPVVLGLLGDPQADVSGWEVTGVNDHHAFARIPEAARPEIGSVVRLGISHPCGAFDRWSSIPLLDRDGDVSGLLTTCFAAPTDPRRNPIERTTA